MCHSAEHPTQPRGEVLERLLTQLRSEVLAPCMMQSVLAGLREATGAAGVAVLDLLALDEAQTIRHAAGAPVEPVLEPALALLAREPDAPATVDGPGMLGCTASTRFGGRAGLTVWRAGNGPAWTEDERAVLLATAGIVRIILEHEAIQRELARQTRSDPLTGLLTRRAFLEEATRRIGRLERDGVPVTLLLVDLDRLKPLNERRGTGVGDAALVATAGLLRRIVRPSDLVARLGADEFALWLDGSDALTAAERAESLRLGLPRATAHLTAGEPGGLTASIGIACRQPGSGEDLERLLQRADRAMNEVKRASRGRWRVSQEEP